MSLAERWGATWRALGVAPPSGLFEAIIARYAEAHRHYHTPRHLEECFEALEGVRGEAERPGEVELALWFHDAIYDTRRHDNEQRSAEWARAVAAEAGLEAQVGERVAALVMATRHEATPVGADACVLVDVDLSILAAEPLRFDEYERQVREEYRWVPEPVFRRERRRILRRLLERPALYNTARMRESHERRARANLERSLSQLKPWAGTIRAAARVLYYLGLRRKLHPPLGGTGPGKAAESAYAVTCDDDGVTVARDGKAVESVRWADMTSVSIEIDDSFLPQPWWIVRGANGGCMYPNDARGAEAALDPLAGRLPGFDYAAVIKAMGLTSGGVVVWQRTPAAVDRRSDAADA
jgi:predicted metal-dependent HD superfamily phosphohydrolase